MIADLLTGTLAEEVVLAFQKGLRVFAVTTPASLAAALAARRLGAGGLAIAGGFTALDADPLLPLVGGEAALFFRGPVQRDWATDIFTLLWHGRTGVAVVPAQLDAAGRTNLSGIGPPGRPKVALIGPRGLPDNNASPSWVWYLLAAHSPRALVERVDVVCGAIPPAGAPRALLTPAGCFDLGEGGWRARWLAPGGDELAAAVPALGVEIPDGTPVREAPSPETLAALDEVDPQGYRRAEFG